MRLVIYGGMIFTEGKDSDYEWDADGQLICHNEAMTDAAQLRVIDFPGATSPGVMHVRLFEKNEETKS